MITKAKKNMTSLTA